MANYEATKYDFSGSNLSGIQGVNTGIIVPWSNASVPSGFLECAGAAVSRTTYAALFAVIADTYGAGDGSTTFNLPDLTDRIIVSKSPSFALASTGGADAVAATGNISGAADPTALTTPTIAAHTHPDGARLGGGGAGPRPAAPGTAEGTTSRPSFNATGTVSAGAAGGDGAHTHPLAATFTGGSDSVLQPYLTVMYIIKT